MSVRLCPRCSTLIESGSAIFCYNCGQELEVSASEGLSPESLESGSLLKPRKGRSLFLLSTFSLVLFLILTFSLVYLKANPTFKPEAAQRPSSNEFVSTVAALPIPPFTFGKKSFTSLTPSSVQLYLESTNPKIFLEKLLGEKERERLKDKVGLSLEEITSFFEPNFAFVKSSSAEETALAFLTVGKDLDFLRERSAKLLESGKSDGLGFLVLGEYYVVSNSKNLLTEIEDTYEKLNLPLSLTARFQETQKQLPREGQVFIYGKDAESLLGGVKIYFGEKLNSAVRSLKGSSFVVSAVDGGTVVRGFP